MRKESEMERRRLENEEGKSEEIKHRIQRTRERWKMEKMCVCECVSKKEKGVKEREQTVPEDHSSRI